MQFPKNYDWSKEKRKIKKNEEPKRPDPVQVHLIKLQDLPEPLNLKEFNSLVQEELDHDQYPNLKLGNIRLATARYSPRSPARKEDEMQINIFSTYLQVYDLFK